MLPLPPQVAADPNTLYPILIDSPAVSTLAGLLTHDNTDIAVEVLDLLEQLTDAGGCVGVWEGAGAGGGVLDCDVEVLQSSVMKSACERGGVGGSVGRRGSTACSTGSQLKLTERMYLWAQAGVCLPAASTLAAAHSPEGYSRLLHQRHSYFQ